jgi:hypothetical protein
MQIISRLKCYSMEWKFNGGKNASAMMRGTMQNLESPKKFGKSAT